MNVDKAFNFRWLTVDILPRGEGLTQNLIGWHLTSTNKEYVPVFMLMNELTLKCDSIQEANLSIIQELVIPKEQYSYGYRQRPLNRKRDIDRGIGEMYYRHGVLAGCCTSIIMKEERIKPLYMLVIHRKYIPYFYSQIILEKPINNLIFEWWFYSDRSNEELLRWMLPISRGVIKKNNIKTKYISSWKDVLDMPKIPKMRTMREYREFMDLKVDEWGKNLNLQSFIQVGQELDTIPF